MVIKEKKWVDITRGRIKELLKDRLNKLGSVRTDDAWQICKPYYAYPTVVQHFKAIMVEMRDKDMAEQVDRGVWWIYRQKK